MKIARFEHQGRAGDGVVVDDSRIVEPSDDFLARHADIRSVLAASATAILPHGKFVLPCSSRDSRH